MSGVVSECPARTVYDLLVAEPAPTAQRYRVLAESLRPLWIEEVVCPIHMAVRHLGAAATAAESSDRAVAAARHEAAQAALYKALATTRLLTYEEALQEVAVEGLVRGPTPDARLDGQTVHGWNAWRDDGNA